MPGLESGDVCSVFTVILTRLGADISVSEDAVPEDEVSGMEDEVEDMVVRLRCWTRLLYEGIVDVIE